MARKVLNWDRSITPQETGYWCGPAATQVVLNARGVKVAESQLARECKTHTGGTDHIGLITNVLNNRVGSYASVQMPNDPPSAAQRTKLWNDIKSSIDAGYGVVVNIVSPPSNRPRGVNGSQSPSYGSGTIYHYIAVMGYDDSNNTLLVADSGFRPFEYWVTLHNLATLVPPKGYSYCTRKTSTTPSTPAPTPAPSTAQKSGRIYHELTNAFTTRVQGSKFRDTLVGYVLQSDRYAYELEKKIDALEAELNRVLETVRERGE